MAMTLQQVYDTVVSHLLQQGERSLRPDGATCAYRGEGGLKCAVGVLIKDEFYLPEIEGVVVGGDARIELALYLSGVIPSEGRYRYLHLLGELQGIHDERPPESWLQDFSVLATEWNLNEDVLMKYAEEL